MPKTIHSKQHRAIVERLRQARIFGAGNFVQGDGI